MSKQNNIISEKSKDELQKELIDLVMSYENQIENVIERSLEWELSFDENTLKTGKIDAIKDNNRSQHNIIPICIYDKQNDSFKWFGSIYDIFYDHMLKFFVENVCKNRTEEKLLQVLKNIFSGYEGRLPYNNKFIPYFVALLNPGFNLVRFGDSHEGNVSMYMLIDLNIENRIDYNRMADFFDCE